MGLGYAPNVKCRPIACLIQRLRLAAVVLICAGLRAASPDDNWDTGIRGSEDFINSLLKVGNDLYADGPFTNIGGVNASHIARHNGADWQSLAEGISSSVDMTVSALAFFQGSVYAGGNFQQAGTNSANSIARWDGTNWFPCGEGV